MILDSTTLDFYKWDGDVKDKLSAVKDKINELADSWTREQKDHCLEETHLSFKVRAQSCIACLRPILFCFIYNELRLSVFDVPDVPGVLQVDLHASAAAPAAAAIIQAINKGSILGL